MIPFCNAHAQNVRVTTPLNSTCADASSRGVKFFVLQPAHRANFPSTTMSLQVCCKNSFKHSLNSEGELLAQKSRSLREPGDFLLVSLVQFRKDARRLRLCRIRGRVVNFRVPVAPSCERSRCLRRSTRCARQEKTRAECIRVHACGRGRGRGAHACMRPPGVCPGKCICGVAAFCLVNTRWAPR